MEKSPPRVELPAAFEDVDIDTLVHLTADMMDRVISHNDQIPLSPEAVTRFHSRTAPGISVLDYLRRIVKFTKVEHACLLIILHYIDQIYARRPSFTITSLTCHRFLITALAISSKAFSDVFTVNSVRARVGGIPVAELNMLEREFLQMIDWHLTCTREVLQEYYVNLVRTHSNGTYFISAREPSSSLSSDSDMDWDAGVSSRPSTPEPASTNAHPSTILIDTATLSPEPPRPPTLEQNMAFAAFQQSSQIHSLDDTGV